MRSPRTVEPEADVWILVAEVRAELKSSHHPDGFTIGLNDGEAVRLYWPQAVPFPGAGLDRPLKQNTGWQAKVLRVDCRRAWLLRLIAGGTLIPVL